MALKSEQDTINSDILASLARNVDIIAPKQSHPEQTVKHFDFDLTCDVICDVT